MMRKLRGPAADWDLTALLLRRIDLHLAGANWQRGNGKGAKPKPIALPEDKRPGRQKDPLALQKLRALGLMNDGTPPDSD